MPETGSEWHVCIATGAWSSTSPGTARCRSWPTCRGAWSAASSACRLRPPVETGSHMKMMYIAAALAAAVPNPAVTVPSVPGSHNAPFAATAAADLAASQYSETEFFLSGSANAYEKDGAWGLDGVWKTRVGKLADFTVR